MGLSRSSRITILLVIDVVFFLVELIVGYAVGSLALVADSFHMLNDVMSLIVALYAIKLTAQEATDSRYSYGWHRAEILAALVNGVFLLALCFSISLEALERFFSTPEISNPRLVVIVGSLGLASNIVGLFLFHEHGHDHGHSHGPTHPSSPPSTVTPSIAGDVTPTQKQLPIRIKSRSRSPSHTRTESYASMYGHPAATRASLMQTAQEMAHARSPSPPPSARRSSSRVRLSLDSRPSLQSPSTSAHNTSMPRADESLESLASATEEEPLLSPRQFRSNGMPRLPEAVVDSESTHSHDHRHSAGGHGHAHGSMNMRALVLHVLGDALGNVGVIATGLVIWLTSWSFKYYFDPVISLVITVIIFSSALPLVRSASFILLQGVPPQISLDDVRESILDVEGVLSLHELHVWQLSESKIIASVHVLTSRNHDFMPVASKIREALHHHGIHSSTIQPEYLGQVEESHLKPSAETSCLIMCPPNQCDPQEEACCPPARADV